MILEKKNRPSSTFPVTPLYLLLLQEEDLLLLQEEDLLLAEEEDLPLAKEEDREGSPEKLKMVDFFFPESSGDLRDQFR